MSDSVWHVTVAGQAQGPFTLEEVVARLGRDLGPETLVWNPSLSGWLPLSSVPELASHLQARPAPAPPAPAPTRPVAARPAANPYQAPRGAPAPRASAGEEEPTLNPFKLMARSFRWRGKFTRGEFAMVYLVGGFIINTLFLCLAFLVLVLGAKAVGGDKAAGIGGIVFVIVALIDSLAIGFVALGAVVRRLNDLGKPSWWILGMVVPLLSFVLLLYLLFAQSDPDAQIPESFAAVWIVLALSVVLVIVIGGIMAAIAIPALLRAKMSANESASIGDLRAMISAQVTYSTANGGAYESRAECLSSPANGCIPGYTGPNFLYDTLTSGPRHGYTVALHGGSPMQGPGMSPSSVSTFVVVAAPITPGQTGTRLFCADQNGVVCSATGVSADDLVSRNNGDVSCSSICSPLF